jgi:hypothetical protein
MPRYSLFFELRRAVGLPAVESMKARLVGATSVPDPAAD